VEVSSFETSVPVRKDITFDPTVWSPSNFSTSGCGIPTRWGGGLVAPDYCACSKGLQLLIWPLDLPQIFKGVLDVVFLRVDVELLLGEAEVSSLETSVTVRKGNNFRSDRWVTLKILEEFLDGVLIRVDAESILSVVEVSSLQTRVAVWKGHNFWSDRWISLKFIQVFQNIIFLGVDVELLLGEVKVSSLETSIPIRKGLNFWCNRRVGSPLKF